MIRIVYARKGSFRLSEAAVDMFLERCKDYDREDVELGDIPRHHPVLVEVVEKLGNKAAGSWFTEPTCHLKISDPIPSDVRYALAVSLGQSPSLTAYSYMIQTGWIEERREYLLMAKAAQALSGFELGNEIRNFLLDSSWCVYGRDRLTKQDVLEMPEYIRNTCSDADYQEMLAGMAD